MKKELPEKMFSWATVITKTAVDNKISHLFANNHSILPPKLVKEELNQKAIRYVMPK